MGSVGMRECGDKQWRSHTRACPGTGPGNSVLGPGNKHSESNYYYMSTWHGLSVSTSPKRTGEIR